MARKGRSLVSTDTLSKKVIPFSGGATLIQFGSLIKEKRSALKMSQEALAETMGVTRHSIINWESDKSRPDYELIPMLCSVLGIQVQDLFGIRPQFDFFEQEVIDDLRRMKPATRVMAANMLRNMADEEENDELNKVVTSTRIVAFEPSAAAAGTISSGVEFNELKPEPFFLRMTEENRKADAVLRVSGHSMEPEYKNGCLVYFEFAEAADPGDDVVLRVGGTAFIKRLDENRQPYSINPAFPFEYDGDGEDISIIGKVLGIISTSDLPPKKYQNLLYEMLEDELHEFNEEHGIVD